jgi:hypothetical protein
LAKEHTVAIEKGTAILGGGESETAAGAATEVSVQAFDAKQSSIL